MTTPALPYAQPKDLLSYAFNKADYDRLDPNSIIPAINAASDLSNGYLSSQFNLPLLKFGSDLTMNVCFIAAFFLQIKIGFNPNSPQDGLIKARYDLAIKWLESIANEVIHPTYEDTPTDSQNEFVLTTLSRGYNTPTGEDI